MDVSDRFGLLYEDGAAAQKERAQRLTDGFSNAFGHMPSACVSAPGRSEIIGNHTDHQNGCVVAAAIDADIMAVCSPRNDGIIRIVSEGYGEISLDVSDDDVHRAEAGTSAALVRGTAKGLRDRGLKAGGFEAFIDSRVDAGSGLSSSAAFENLCCGIYDHLFNSGDLGAVETALTSRFAENVYFMKPCGLEDQLASALGGISYIDFRESLSPECEALKTDFSRFGYSLIITNTGGSHADLTDDYAAITREMYAVAGYFGEASLRRVREEDFYSSLGKLRELYGDRAVLRAHHFFTENRRPALALERLKEGDMPGFITLLNESGDSSSMYLQNLYSPSDPSSQRLNTALVAARRLLAGRGSARVHGGGFAGTVACVVPEDLSGRLIETMDGIFGPGSAREYRIRKYGVFRLF